MLLLSNQEANLKEFCKMIINIFLYFKNIFTIEIFFKIFFNLLSKPIYALEENIQFSCN